MCVSPSEFASAFDIACGEVHATDESYLTIDDHQFSVVAVVDFRGESGELHGHESVDVDAGIAHALIKASFHLPACHVVVDDPHFHAFLSFVDERVGDEVAQCIVGEDEDVDMYMVAGLADLVEQ